MYPASERDNFSHSFQTKLLMGPLGPYCLDLYQSYLTENRKINRSVWQVLDSEQWVLTGWLHTDHVWSAGFMGKQGIDTRIMAHMHFVKPNACKHISALVHNPHAGLNTNFLAHLPDGRRDGNFTCLANGEFHDVPVLTNVLPGWKRRAAFNVQPWITWQSRHRHFLCPSKMNKHRKLWSLLQVCVSLQLFKQDNCYMTQTRPLAVGSEATQT